MVFKELYYIPEEVVVELDDELIANFLGSNLWCMTAMDDDEQLLGAAVFSIMPDKENAILGYLYENGDNNVGKDVIIQSVKTLKEHEITRISFFAEENSDADYVLKVLKDGLKEKCSYETIDYYEYEYKQIRDSELFDNQNESEFYDNNDLIEVRSLDNADAWDVRDILDDIGINHVVHEQDRGIGLFAMDDDRMLMGVALGNADYDGNYYLSAYYDSDEGNDEQMYRRLILGVMDEFLREGKADNKISVICNTDTAKVFLRDNFGVALRKGAVVLAVVTL